MEGAFYARSIIVTYQPGTFNFHLSDRLNTTEFLYKTHLNPLGPVGFSRSRTMCAAWMREAISMKAVL